MTLGTSVFRKAPVSARSNNSHPQEATENDQMPPSSGVTIKSEDEILASVGEEGSLKTFQMCLPHTHFPFKFVNSFESCR